VFPSSSDPQAVIGAVELHGKSSIVLVRAVVDWGRGPRRMGWVGLKALCLGLCQSARLDLAHGCHCMLVRGRATARRSEQVLLSSYTAEHAVYPACKAAQRCPLFAFPFDLSFVLRCSGRRTSMHLLSQDMHTVVWNQGRPVVCWLPPSFARLQDKSTLRAMAAWGVLHAGDSAELRNCTLAS
jgi:hypothetical protein